jgi:hypothetical protein
MSTNWREKNLQLKKFKIFFWSKIAIYLSLGLHKGRPSYRRSLQPSNENIQHFQTWNFLIFFSIFVGHFLTSLIRIQSVSGSGSNADTDPKHCLKIAIYFSLLSTPVREQLFKDDGSELGRWLTRITGITGGGGGGGGGQKKKNVGGGGQSQKIKRWPQKNK